MLLQHVSDAYTQVANCPTGHLLHRNAFWAGIRSIFALSPAHKLPHRTLTSNIVQVMAQDIAICTESADDEEDDNHLLWRNAIRCRAPDLANIISRNVERLYSKDELHFLEPRFQETLTEWERGCALVISTNELILIPWFNG